MFTTMYNLQALHANKRKQDSSNFAAVDEVIPTGEFNSKKQRLSFEQFPVNGKQTQYNGNNAMISQMNGHSQVSNNHIETDSGHLQDLNAATTVYGQMENGDARVSEPMECVEEQGNHTKVEVNGNVTSTSYGKYCPHGHLNMCTTYNVPCRYPRMYCHPGGLLEDRLSIYHGF